MTPIGSFSQIGRNKTLNKKPGKRHRLSVQLKAPMRFDLPSNPKGSSVSYQRLQVIVSKSRAKDRAREEGKKSRRRGCRNQREMKGCPFLSQPQAGSRTTQRPTSQVSNEVSLIYRDASRETFPKRSHCVHVVALLVQPVLCCIRADKSEPRDGTFPKEPRRAQLTPQRVESIRTRLDALVSSTTVSSRCSMGIMNG